MSQRSGEQLMTEFCDAWSRLDYEAVLELFTDDAFYHNIPMEPCCGKDAMRAFIEQFMSTMKSIDFEIVNQVVSDRLIMNERIDTIVMGDRTIPLRVMGVFELAPDGRISAWRDYFDMAEFQASAPPSE